MIQKVLCKLKYECLCRFCPLFFGLCSSDMTIQLRLRQVQLFSFRKMIYIFVMECRETRPISKEALMEIGKDVRRKILNKYSIVNQW